MESAQKNSQKIVKFVNTFGMGYAIIILVKTPQYIIYSFAIPHSKNTFS